MASTPASRDQLAGALVALIERLQRHYDLKPENLIKEVAASDVAAARSAEQPSRKVGMTRAEYYGFLQRLMPKHLDEVARAVKKYIATCKRSFDNDPIVHSMAEYIFGNDSPLPQSKSTLIASAFEHRRLATEDVVNVIKNYAGVYQIFRYAAHSHDNSMPQTRARQRSKPHVIRAAMEIHAFEQNPGSLPTFTIWYRPGSDFANRIPGIIIPIGEQLYFLGRENSSHPLVMVTDTPEGEPVTRLNGLVLRRHESLRYPIASRFVCLRTQATIAEEIKLVGNYPEDDELISNLIAPWIKQMYNNTVPPNQGVLTLWRAGK